MLLFILIFTVCLTVQIYVVNRYGIFGNKTPTVNIKNLLKKNSIYSGNKLLDTLIKLHSCLYKRQINEKNREAFLTTLVHDLKTPATAQIHSLELLLDGRFGQINESQKTILKEMLSSERYMSDIVTNILTAYKCDCNKLILNRTPYNIKKQIIDVCNTLAKLAAEKNQKILLNLPKNQVIIYSDNFQIQRVITNLISNAIKYGLRNSQIIVDLTVRNQTFNFSVTSKSHYIPKDRISKIFDKFSGYDSVASGNAGTGLGLYLSKKIIELHGGKIYAESFLDSTCIFGFHLRAITPIKKEKSTLNNRSG